MDKNELLNTDFLEIKIEDFDFGHGRMDARIKYCFTGNGFAPWWKGEKRKLITMRDVFQEGETNLLARRGLGKKSFHIIKDIFRINGFQLS